jgi:glycogen debranching enzyme
MLSRLELELAGRQPSLLGAAISQDNTLFTAHLTNQPLPALGERSIPKEVIHIERNRFLWKNRLYERVRLTNFSGNAAQVPLRLCFAADFADIFEVQGLARKQRGTSLEPEVSETSVRLSYRGLDRKLRSTAVRFGSPPDTLSSEEACFTLELRRGGVAELYFEIGANGTSCPCAERFEAGRHSRLDPIPTPAFPGLRRSSVATRSSLRCRCCG